jgi:iron complex outermembrane recepter protein
MQSSTGKWCAPGRASSHLAIVKAIRGACFAGGATALMLASSAGYAADAAGDANDQSSEVTLQEVVVTGSLIRRTDTETASPMQVISAEDLVNSGYTSVSDVLRNLSANGQGTLTQSFNQAFAGGGAGVALRGLTVGATLTLIDGERMVPYPLSDDGQRTFVDVSDLPFNAVDHIEVLKDGASAIYGSDAIAGVVNVILKKTYTGFEAGAEAGTSEKNDGTTEHFTAIAGMGDIGSDGYNAYVTLEFRHQDDILQSHRSGEDWTNLNFTSLGGQNTTPGIWNLPSDPYPGSISGYLINPNTASGTPYAFLPGCSQALANAGDCTYALKGLQLQPTSENINVLGRLTVAMPGDWQFVGTASFFKSESEQIGPVYPGADSPSGSNGTGYPGGLFNVSIGPGVNPTVVPAVPLVITVPATYPGNPFGVAAPLAYNFHELGLSSFFYNTDTYRLFGNVKGTSFGWDIDGSAGIMYATTGQTFYGGIEPTALQAALNNPTNPYIVGINATGAGASAFSPAQSTTDTDTLDVLDLHGSRKLFDLPGGPLSFGLGAQFVRRVLNALAPPLVAEGIASGNNAFAVGSQDDTAGFAELSALPLKGLELDAAIRYDRYNTYGGSSTPKFGIKWTPFDQITFRGTYSQGFRAPNPAESGDSGEAFLAATIADPTLCPHPAVANTPGNFPSQCSVNLLGVQNSNPKLLPERSDSYTAGLIFQPIKPLSVSADYYDIKINRDIISSFELGGLASLAGANIPGAAFIRGPAGISEPFVNPNGTISNAPTPVGLILYQPYPYVNASQDNTNGIDVDLKANFDLGPGKLSAELNYTHVIEYNLIAFGTTFHLAGTHGPSGVSGDTGNPQDRAVFAITYDVGAFSATATTNYISSFSVIDPSAGQYTCAEALESNFTNEYGSKFLAGATFPSSLCRVGSFTDEDLYMTYKLTNHFQVHGQILNLFGAQPPLDVVTYGGGGGSAYDAAMHQAGAVGRFFMIGANYKF